MAEVKRLLPLCGRAGCRFLQRGTPFLVPGKSGDEKQPGHSEIPFVAVVENGA
jgi:hypothetical protein